LGPAAAVGDHVALDIGVGVLVDGDRGRRVWHKQRHDAVVVFRRREQPRDFVRNLDELFASPGPDIQRCHGTSSQVQPAEEFEHRAVEQPLLVDVRGVPAFGITTSFAPGIFAAMY